MNGSAIRRTAELDSLRGLAAIAVVLFHLRFSSRTILGSAVDLFFVLSGYLITRIILEESGQGGFFRVFYTRRVLRIFPVYYVALALVVVTNRWRFAPEPLEGLWRYLTYTQFLEGYWTTPSERFSRWFLHSWTLALEEQFYLVWPVAAWLMGRRGILRAALPLVGLAVYLRTLGVHEHLLLTRCDGLMMGAALAALLVDAAWTGRHRRGLLRGFAAAWLAGTAARFALVRLLPITVAWAPGTHLGMFVNALIVTAQ
jgi:peptidoglycan/LPS O-acetylase OafA/YrhL